MKWLIVGIGLLLGACTHLPTIQPMDAASLPRIETACRSHFAKGRWQLVHTISARLNGGRPATFTGVVVLSTTDRSIHCVLMTLEGMVLFEAIHDGQDTTVQRAFGPFDNHHFAQGVMADIRFLFFGPQGRLVAGGITEEDSRVCRFQGPHETIVDLMESADGEWRMQQYDERGRIIRRVTASAVDSRGIASRMVIDAGSGRRAYGLSLNLVEAVALPN
jgi:hypothetical protein